MDPLKKETSEVFTATPGRDHEKHSGEMIKNIAGKTGLPPDQLIPADKRADALIQTQTKNFIESVAHVEEVKLGEAEPSDQPSDLNRLGETLNAFSPVGDDYVRTADGKIVSEIEEEKIKEKEAA